MEAGVAGALYSARSVTCGPGTIVFEAGSVVTQPQEIAASNVRDFPLRTSLVTKDHVQTIRNKLTIDKLDLDHKKDHLLPPNA